MIELSATAADAPLLDDRIRGVPPGTSAFPAAEVASRRWRPADGTMSLPALTLDEVAFLHNRDLMLAYARAAGVEIAPHAKTPMAPDLAQSLIDGGAWGATVADPRQAAVMLRSGVSRLILANEIGGKGGARRLAALKAAWPEAELLAFADSVSEVEALAAAWAENPAAPPLRVLPEIGAGRAGARTEEQALAIAKAIVSAKGRLVLAGVGAYEGSASRETPEATAAAIESLLKLGAKLLPEVRALAGTGAPLIVTAGGSLFFDRVVAALKPAVDADGNASLIIRSGAIFFHDHGIYDRGLGTLDARQGFALQGKVEEARRAFRPTLRVWAEVLSRPEPDLAICGMGKRDVSFDEGLPMPLSVHRDGQALNPRPQGQVLRLNDQHAFLSLGPGEDLRVGDVVEFGISHPCTCIDRYRFIFGLDAQGYVAHAFPTYFG